MLKSLSPGALALVLFAGCFNPVAPPIDPYAKACEAVACGKGHCVLDLDRPACLCDATYRPEGLSCVLISLPPADKCKPNPCVQANRTACSVVNDEVKCACQPGTYESNGQCLTQTPCSPNPCTGTNQTSCSVLGNGALCSCNAGYAPLDGGCGTDKVFDCALQHTGAPGDALEPDECPMLAQGIYTDDTVQTGHTINPAGDVDWFQITAEAGHVYRVNATATGTLGLYVDIFAGDGASLVGFDHRGTLAPTARFKASTGGVHYIRVRAFRASDTGPYDLAAADLGLDDYADTTGLATPAAIGGTFAGELQFPADLDVVKLPLPGGHKYALSSGDAGYFPGLTLELIGSDGVSATRRSAAAPVGIITRPSVSGDGYLRVSNGGAGVLGSFSFALLDLGPDDHGDVAEEATTLTPGASSVPASFELPGDVDYFTFTAQAGHVYSFLCTPASGGYYGCLTTITDASGAVLANSSSGYTSVVSYEFTLPGPFFIRTSTQYSYGGTASTYTYRFEDLGVDDFGDTPATASPIGVGATAITGRLETSLDKDVFSFATLASHVYRFTCTPGAGLSSCYPQLLNASGAVVSSAGPGTSVTYETGAAGTLYGQAGGSTYGYGGTNGSYSVAVEDLGVDDCGDTIATASPISVSATFTGGMLESPLDLDVFSFSATAPNIYRFSCIVSGGSYGGCSLRLKNSGGAVLQSSTGSSSPSIVALEVTSSGTYYVEVGSGYGYGSGSSSYTWRLENLGPDDHGDDRLTATPITVTTSPLSGMLETPTDVDAFSFTATAAHIYKFSCASVGYSSCGLTLRNPLGASVAIGTSSGGGTNSVSWEVPTSGTYTVDVGGGYNWSASSYTVSLEDLGLDDHGDTLATATALTVPTAATAARLEAVNDLDVFSFTATADRIYGFTVAGGSGTSVQLRLKDGLGTVLASSSYSPIAVNFKAPASATYYVEVSVYSSYSGGTGSYTFQLADLGLDDHGNSIATATALPALASPVAGSLQYAGDEDFFSISLTAGTARQAISTGVYVYLTVYSPGGGQLGYESSTVNFTPTVAGTYYLRVRASYSSGSGGAYQLRVQ